MAGRLARSAGWRLCSRALGVLRQTEYDGDDDVAIAVDDDGDDDVVDEDDDEAS